MRMSETKVEDGGVSAAKAAAKEALQGVSKPEAAVRTATVAPPPRKRCLYVVRVVRAEPVEPKDAQATDEKRAQTSERIAALSQTIAEKQVSAHWIFARRSGCAVVTGSRIGLRSGGHKDRSYGLMAAHHLCCPCSTQELRRAAREQVATAREALRERGAEIRARQEVLRPLQSKLKEFTDAVRVPTTSVAPAIAMDKSDSFFPHARSTRRSGTR